MSGYGAGVEDLNLRFGKMAVAFVSAARPDIVTQNGNLAKSNIDVRLYDLKGPLGLWGGWFDYATSKGGTTVSGATLPPGTATVTPWGHGADHNRHHPMVTTEKRNQRMATTEEIRADLAEIVNEVAGIPVEDVQLDKSFVDDLDVDSLSMVEVVVAAEEKFGVSIPDDEVKNLKTVGDAVAFIERAQG